MTARVPSARYREAVRAGREDRTAYRHLGGSFHSSTWGMVEVRDWPTREAMARVIRREQKHAPYSQWTPVVPLGIVEGYR